MATSTPLVNLQGNPTNGAQIDPDNFFRFTRRQRGVMAASIGAFAGLGAQDFMELKQTGILGAVDVKFEGSLVLTLGTGTVATTSKWPYSFLKLCQLSGNGQSNLISANGQFLKARELISNPTLNDRGVPQTIGGATVYQGTYSLNEEQWGVGQNSTALAGGTYTVELSWRIPVAWDLQKLFGALYLQTSATSVDIIFNWAPVTDLFILTGTATAVLTGSLMAEGVVFTIPNVNGLPVLPDLSTFHAFTQNNTSAIGTTANTPVLAGQGVNKQLMRVLGNIWTGTTGPGGPLGMTKANYGNIGWGYGLSETPEIWQDGDSMALDLDRSYSSDLSKYQGLFAVDFARHWSFRDSVDEGSASQISLVLNVLASVTSPRLEYVQEVMINAASGS